MRDKLKKLALVFMALCLLIMTAAPAQVKAADKVALDKKKLTLMVGDHADLYLNNVPWADILSVTWSSSNEAVAAIDESYGDFAVIHVKKKGTAKITARYKNKEYICTVKVKKFALSNTEGKNEKDVKTLKAIIKKQNLKGATLSTDLDSDIEDKGARGYRWDEKGNLTGINWNYSELQGSLSLKAFESLELIDVTGNFGLSSLDVSKNTALTYLYCGGCSLSKLDVGKNTTLTYLSCYNNRLSSLDVSKNTALTELWCSNNQLRSLDVSKNTALTELYCYKNQLRSLDLGKNAALTELYCYENQLRSLDLGKNTALTYLNCDNNQLSSLDVSKNMTLTYLNCNDNQLSSLDVSKNMTLTYLNCSNNQLSSLDVSKNTALETLYCSNNQLSSLDLSNNKALTYLRCDENVKVTGWIFRIPPVETQTKRGIAKVVPFFTVLLDSISLPSAKGYARAS